MNNRARLRGSTIGSVIALSIVFAWCASSSAAAHRHPSHRHRHHRHRVHHHPPGRGTGVTGGALTPSTPASGPTPAALPQTWDNPDALVALGNLTGCVYGGEDPVPYLRRWGAEILRIVISPDLPGTSAESVALPCVNDAVSAGYKLNLVIGYSNSWSAGDIVDYFNRILGIYGQYAWAISIGNEQELNQDGSQSGEQYAKTWKVVEPIVAAKYPQAIRVAGEISPWGLPFIQSALAIGLPGAQALAAHPYARPHGFAAIDFATLAQGYGLQVWYSEGLAAPDAWGASIPLSLMPDASMAGIWLN
jgi:hypothetical protein